MDDNIDKETREYLARIRKTIEASSNLVEQVGLRIRETDRLLESQGLTREQVMSMRFSETQKDAANAELRRRGLDPIEIWDELDGERARPVGDFEPAPRVSSEAYADDEVSYRQKKFGMMMKPFQI
jgi:hypothetical protein